MKQTRFAAPAVRSVAAAIFQQLAPPATATAASRKAAAIDLFDGGILSVEEARRLGGFQNVRDWNGTARQHRVQRKRRAL